MTIKSQLFLHDALNAAARECVRGTHLNGKDRIKSLRLQGFSDSQILDIQKRVNKIMRGR